MLRKINFALNSLLFVMVIITTVFLSLSKVAGFVTNETYFQVYLPIGLLLVILSAFSTFMSARGLDSKNPVDLETEKYRPFANPVFRVAGVLLLALLAFGAASSGVNIGAPNPYSADLLSSSVVNEHSLFMNLVLIAWIPGLYEELLIYYAITASAFGIVLLWRAFTRKENPLVFWAANLSMVLVWSLMFSLAHRSAYGGNSEAFVSAFVFEMVSQFSNQLVGAPISFLGHMAHNAVVVFNTQTAFAFGGAAAAMIFFARKRWFA